MPACGRVGISICTHMIIPIEHNITSCCPPCISPITTHADSTALSRTTVSSIAARFSKPPWGQKETVTHHGGKWIHHTNNSVLFLHRMVSLKQEATLNKTNRYIQQPGVDYLGRRSEAWAGPPTAGTSWPKASARASKISSSSSTIAASWSNTRQIAGFDLTKNRHSQIIPHLGQYDTNFNIFCK